MFSSSASWLTLLRHDDVGKTNARDSRVNIERPTSDIETPDRDNRCIDVSRDVSNRSSSGMPYRTKLSFESFYRSFRDNGA